jgi:transposase
MVATRAPLPDLDGLDAHELKALIVSQHELIVSRDGELERLKLLIAKLQRMRFGRSSEKLDRQIEQLELQLEALQQNDAEKVAALPEPLASAEQHARRARRPLPAHLPREVRTYPPKQEACPECGGKLKHLGEDVSEMLEIESIRFKVIRQVRPKMACAGCDRIVQAEAPSRPIARGVAGPGLLAHVLASKFADHLPLYRQSEIYARQGVDLDRSTLADWVCGTSQLFEPLVEALRRHVMAAQKLHADDTPVPVLAPGNGKTKTGRLWTYVRDDRPGRDTSSGVVRLLTGSQGRTPADTPEQVPRNAAGGCLRGLRADLRNRTHSGSSLLGTRAPEVLRSACRSQISRRGGSAKANRRALCDRERHPRTNARRTARGPQHAQPAVARIPETMAGRDVG